MKAVISSTYDDKYLFYVPIITWAWDKVGVGVICFVPLSGTKNSRRQLIINTLNTQQLNAVLPPFEAPENKQATYSQCSRLYAACLDLPEDEILITSDVDMAVFKVPEYIGGFTITGTDLIPNGQYPMCYISAKAKDWRNAFGLHDKTYQQCLDETIGLEECENMRGNLWSRDQETAFNKISLTQEINTIPRSNGQNQFAQNRVDRDDTNWRSYVNNELIDAHLWRPGYEDGNFANILELLQTKYPNENFDWLVNYRNEYIKLL